jgi:ABC-type Mn2+/Zn2+ transport system permease subunit
MLLAGVAFRPLMLTSAPPEVAEARGVSTRRVDLYFLVVVALPTVWISIALSYRTNGARP